MIQRVLEFSISMLCPVNCSYCPQKLIGIMTGHLQFEQGKEPLDRKQESFTRHSGLSYFTKITALKELLNKNGL